MESSKSKPAPHSRRGAHDPPQGVSAAIDSNQPTNEGPAKQPYEPPIIEEVGDLDKVRGAVIGPTGAV